MRKMLFCKVCGFPIAEIDGDGVKIKHRGRTIIAYGSVSIQCEKCGKERFLSAQDLRRLCGNDAAVPARKAGDAGGV